MSQIPKEIISTADIAEQEWDGHSEPSDVDTDMVATQTATNRGIEFHVSMRDYTQRDMEDLIVEAAARTIVGRHNDREMARKIEAKCIELVDAKATSALASVTTDIVDQPLTPPFAGGKAVTMREMIGLYGREYLTQKVDSDGKISSGGYGSRAVPRIEQLATKYLDKKFESEIKKAANAAILEIRGEIARRHQAIIDAELVRFREAFAKATAA